MANKPHQPSISSFEPLSPQVEASVTNMADDSGKRMIEEYKSFVPTEPIQPVSNDIMWNRVVISASRLERIGFKARVIDECGFENNSRNVSNYPSLSDFLDRIYVEFGDLDAWTKIIELGDWETFSPWERAYCLEHLCKAIEAAGQIEDVLDTIGLLPKTDWIIASTLFEPFPRDRDPSYPRDYSQVHWSWKMAPIRDGNQVIRQVVERKYYKRKRQELLESLESLQVEGETADPVVAVEDYRLSGPIEEHMNRKSTGYYGYGRRHGHTEDDFTLQHLNLFDSERHFQQFEVVRILCREATNGLRTIVFFEGQTSNLFHLVQQLSSLEKRYMEIMEPNRFEKILNEDDKKLISSVFSMSISWSPPIEILQQIATLIDDLIKQQPQQKRLRLTLRLIKHWLDIRSVTEWSFACELYSRSPLHSQTSTFYQKIKPTLEDAFHRYKLSWSIDRSIVTKLFDLNKGFYLNPDRTVWNAYRGPTVVKSQDGSWLYEWEMDSTAVEWDKDGKAKSTVQHMKVLHCIVREKEGNIRIQAPEDAAYVLME